MEPATPSEVHRRVYTRALAPLTRVEYIQTQLDDLSCDILEEFLLPAEATDFPPTFGPIDDDPLYALRDAAKNLKAYQIKESPDLSRGKEMLRSGYQETKRFASRTMADRFMAKEVDPYSTYRNSLELNLTVRGIREAAEIIVEASSPETLGAIFLPSSRHFCAGFVAVDSFEVPKFKPMEALNLHRLLGEEQNRQVKVALNACVTKQTARTRIWEHWEELEEEFTKECKRTLSPPLFPLYPYSAHEMVLEERTPFNTGCGPSLRIDRGASVTPKSFIRMTVEDNGVEALSVKQLTEFDTDPFGMLTPSSRAIAGGTEPPPLDLGPGYISVLRQENVGKYDEELTPWRHSDVLGSQPQPYDDFASFELSEPSTAASTPRIDGRLPGGYVSEHQSILEYQNYGDSHGDDGYDQDDEDDGHLGDDDMTYDMIDADHSVSYNGRYDTEHSPLSRGGYQYPSEGTTAYPWSSVRTDGPSPSTHISPRAVYQQSYMHNDDNFWQQGLVPAAGHPSHGPYTSPFGGPSPFCVAGGNPHIRPTPTRPASVGSHRSPLPLKRPRTAHPDTVYERSTQLLNTGSRPVPVLDYNPPQMSPYVRHERGQGDDSSSALATVGSHAPTVPTAHWSSDTPHNFSPYSYARQSPVHQYPQTVPEASHHSREIDESPLARRSRIHGPHLDSDPFLGNNYSSVKNPTVPSMPSPTSISPASARGPQRSFMAPNAGPRF